MRNATRKARVERVSEYYLAESGYRDEVFTASRMLDLCVNVLVAQERMTRVQALGAIVTRLEVLCAA